MNATETQRLSSGKLFALDSLKKTLLHQVFTGQFWIPPPRITLLPTATKFSWLQNVTN